MKLLHLVLVCIILSIIPSIAQKTALTHQACSDWLEIENVQLSADGTYAVYALERGDDGDGSLNIVRLSDQQTFQFERAKQAKIAADNQFIVFLQSPASDSLKAMRRRKMEKEDLPKDTLVVFNLSTTAVEKIPNVHTFKVGKSWGQYVFYQFEPPRDSTQKKSKSKKKGYPLVVYDWQAQERDTLLAVTSYSLAEEQAGLIAHTKGKTETLAAGLYQYDFQAKTYMPIHRSACTYKHIVWDKAATQAAFLADVDTAKALVPAYGIYHWSPKRDSAALLYDDAATFLPDTWRISEHQAPYFSDNGNRLFFGMGKAPVVQDTSLLKEEIVNVEVWHYQDAYLYTQQESNVEREKKRSYLVAYDIAQNKAVAVANDSINRILQVQDHNANVVLGLNRDKYAMSVSWEGSPQKSDVYRINLNDGKPTLIASAVAGNVAIAPKGDYAYWYSRPDSAWFSYALTDNQLHQLTQPNTIKAFDERNDRPMYPSSYRIAGWTTAGHLLVYDRYDIWKLHPENQEKPMRLTQGREQKQVYRYIKLDREATEINPEHPMLLYLFDEKTKGTGYATLDLTTNKLRQLRFGENYNYSSRPVKAKDANVFLTTQENFETFPNLQLTDDSFAKWTQISDANPQQATYNWGTIELYEWTALDGQQLQGLLVKPENFDPNKKYPMLVNFYERSSDRLHRYRTPRHGRSSINYSFYTSRGYVIFNPDVPYRVGYPGESAYNAVIPGVTALIGEGYIDKTRIGVQGHSWGGYQVAYLLTKTDVFACAESGAPVVNMISAYGGIRWGSGLSRMFQYERTQSRIGGTIWEKPLRYIENSPIFFVDKINTPVLILHNDKDGAVPWYQGIEFFVAMRRLQKPAWMLNYNEEPHWPVKLQNRKDFQLRMQQFFDHYLLAQSAPSWMERGVPAVEKGILQGLDQD